MQKPKPRRKARDEQQGQETKERQKPRERKGEAKKNIAKTPLGKSRTNTEQHGQRAPEGLTGFERH